MRTFIAILLIGVLTGCGGKPWSTDTEVQAVQNVLNFYGGQCNRHKGFKKTSGEETETYFELEMSGSELIEFYSDKLALPASNIAYIFYSSLNEEQANYTNVKVKINLADNKSHRYSYTASDLIEIEKSIPILQSVSENIKAKDYDLLDSQFDVEAFPDLTPSLIKSYCAPYDSAYGEIEKTQFQGFAFFESEGDKKPLVHIGGMMKREKNNVPISLIINRENLKVGVLKFEL